MPESQTLINRANAALIQNYARSNVVMDRGEGAHLWDVQGKQYLDLFAGFGGCVLGHAHPELIAAASKQAQKLWHVGNALHTEPQIELAERLKKFAFDGRAFFCHSGLEANEAAIKLARLRGMANGGKKWKTVSLIKSFHGRSLAMIAATGNPAVKEGFGPAVPGFTNVDANDFDAIVKAIDDETCAIIMEPIQGEGGINLYPPGHVAKIRKLCDEKCLTLIFDEVWTGVGRTGKWFGHQWTVENGSVVLPDIMTLGKAIGGGLPVAVMFAKPELAALMVPGKHGCTLGGNPICMAVSRTIFDVIDRDGLVERANALGAYATEKFKTAPSLAGKIKEVRGRGLFMGIELAAEPKAFFDKSLAKGLITNLTSKTVIRLAPPLNISDKLWHEGVDRVIDLIATV